MSWFALLTARALLGGAFPGPEKGPTVQRSGRAGGRQGHLATTESDLRLASWNLTLCPVSSRRSNKGAVGNCVTTMVHNRYAPVDTAPPKSSNHTAPSLK